MLALAMVAGAYTHSQLATSSAAYAWTLLGVPDGVLSARWLASLLLFSQLYVQLLIHVARKCLFIGTVLALSQQVLGLPLGVQLLSGLYGASPLTP